MMGKISCWNIENLPGVAASIHGLSSLPTVVRNIVLWTETAESERDASARSLEFEDNDNDIPNSTVGAADDDGSILPVGVILLLTGWGVFFFTMFVGIPDVGKSKAHNP